MYKGVSWEVKMRLELECFLYTLFLSLLGLGLGFVEVEDDGVFTLHFMMFVTFLLPLYLSEASSRHMMSLLAFEKYLSSLRRVGFWMKRWKTPPSYLSELPQAAKHTLRGDWDVGKSNFTMREDLGSNHMNALHRRLETDVRKLVHDSSTAETMQLLLCLSSVENHWCEVLVNESSRSTPKMVERVIYFLLICGTSYMGLTQAWWWGLSYGFGVGLLFSVACWAAQPFRANSLYLPKARDAVRRNLSPQKFIWA